MRLAVLIGSGQQLSRIQRLRAIQKRYPTTIYPRLDSFPVARMLTSVATISLEAITMHKTSPFLSLALCILVASVIEVRTAGAHGHADNAHTPETIQWSPAPPLVEPGAQFAVLE